MCAVTYNVTDTVVILKYIYASRVQTGGVFSNLGHLIILIAENTQHTLTCY